MGRSEKDHGILPEGQLSILMDANAALANEKSLPARGWTPMTYAMRIAILHVLCAKDRKLFAVNDCFSMRTEGQSYLRRYP